MADVSFSETEEVISQPWTELRVCRRCLVWWYNLTFWRSDINSWETGNSIKPQRPTFLKIDISSYLLRGRSDLDEICGTLMAITAIWSKSQPGEKFQYGGRLFSKTGSIYISAVNWDISTIFGLLIDFGFQKSVTSLDTKPEVILCHHGCHLENRQDVISSPLVVRCGWNFVCRYIEARTLYHVTATSM